MKNHIFLPSLFQGFWDTKNFCTVDWTRVYNLITGGSLREDTNRYRSYRSQGMTTQANQIKQRSKAITPAIECSTGRRNDQVKGYTGISMVDFDHVPDMPATLALLRADPYTFMLYTTLSGEGIRVLYKYEYQHGPVNEQIYMRAFEMGNRYYARLTGLKHDPACKNPARLSALCHDPEAYFNPQANAMLVIADGHLAQPAPTTKKSVEKRVEKRVDKTPKKRLPEPTDGKAELDRAVEKVRRSLIRQGIIYQEGTRNQYIMRMGYQLNKYAIPLQDAINWAVAEFSDYDGDVAGIIESCYKKTNEHGKFVKYSKQPAENKKVTNADIEEFLDSVAEFRYNTTSEKVDVKWKGTASFEPLGERDTKELWRMTNQYFGVNSINLITIENFMGSKFVTAYNPYVEYLQSLPEWDGYDHIGSLCSMVHLDGTHVLDFKDALTRFLVGMVKGILLPKCVNQLVLVFVGMQGIYKTSFFRILSPPEWQRGALTKSDSNFLDKDDLIAMAEFPIIIMDEMDNLKPSTLNKFKAMVTMDHVDVRGHYQRHSEHRQRIASFCGTANNEQFLFDDTGNRRFLPFCVKSIDNVYEQKIDYVRLYSQVMHLYRQGFRSYYTTGEIPLIEQHNLRFMKVNPAEELIMRQFRKPLKGEESLVQMYYASEICNHISAHGRVQYDPNQVGKIMKKMGFESKRDNQGVRYLVIEIKESDIQEKSRNEAQSFMAMHTPHEEEAPADEDLFS